MYVCRKRTRPALQAVSGFLHTRPCNDPISPESAYVIPKLTGMVEKISGMSCGPILMKCVAISRKNVQDRPNMPARMFSHL